MAVECTRWKGFTFAREDDYAWFRDRLVTLKLLYLSYKNFGGLEKIQGHSTGILVAWYEV